MKGEINRILEILEGAKDENGCIPMALVRRAFKKLEQGWIPCSERLPENDDKVLCQTMTKKGIPGFVLGYYYDGEWRCGMNSNVIAWMPLPEPYKEEQE